MSEWKAIERPKEDPRRRLPPWDNRDSIAVIANNGGAGCVIACDGAGIEAAIEDTSNSLRDLGLDNAPDGLSIWEGCYRVEQTYEGDYDSHLDGTFRELTEDEWERFRVTGAPWEYET